MSVPRNGRGNLLKLIFIFRSLDVHTQFKPKRQVVIPRLDRKSAGQRLGRVECRTAEFARYCGLTTSSVTGTRPENLSCDAAAAVRSMMRPLLKGPRSLMRTMTVRPLRTLVTRTIVPKGN